jgi:DNA-binding transcriptional ArsR family regulator
LYSFNTCGSVGGVLSYQVEGEQFVAAISGAVSEFSAAAPCREMARSTLSHHFRVLRDAGLIRTTKQGVENLNCVRWDEVNARFPGLLKAIMKFQP